MINNQPVLVLIAKYKMFLRLIL